jgi:hypothetical protein
MLRSKRYIGQTTWGCTTQVRDPETGKCITRPVDEEQGERRERPDLRIISDELWTAVEENSSSAPLEGSGQAARRYDQDRSQPAVPF